MITFLHDIENCVISLLNNKHAPKIQVKDLLHVKYYLRMKSHNLGELGFHADVKAGRKKN